MNHSHWLFILAPLMTLGTGGWVVDTCVDDDLDGICNEDDCIDDYAGAFLCGVCTTSDNARADRNSSCVHDPEVYGDACGGPAVVGECDSVQGICLCWREDAFDRCLNEHTVEHTRSDETYQVDCKEYCEGTCDPENAVVTRGYLQPERVRDPV